MELTEEELKFWGTKENFFNHTHCDDNSDIVYPHSYVMKLTNELATLQADKLELLAFLQEVDDKVKLGNLNLKSYYLLAKHENKAK